MTEILTRPKLVSFKRDEVPPPGVVYLEADDKILLEAVAWREGLVATVSARVLDPQGKIRVFSRDYGLDDMVTVDPHILEVEEGFLLGVSVRLTGGAVYLGGLYVRLAIARGSVNNYVVLQVLSAAYCTELNPVAWPPGGVSLAQEGPGELAVITYGNPAAGSNFSIAVPSLRRWRVLGVRARLVTDATVGERSFVLAVISVSREVLVAASYLTQSASTTKDYFCENIADEYYQNIVAGRVKVCLPELILDDTFTIQSVVSFLQPGDQFSLVTAIVERWTEL